MILPLALILCFMVGCQEGKEVAEEVPEGITEEEAKVLVEQVDEVWNEGNLTLVEKVYSSELIAHFSGQPEDIVGLESFKNFVKLTRAQFPDLNHSAGEIIVKGNKIACRWTLTGTNTGPLQTPYGELPPTDKKFRVSGLAMIQIVNNKIKELWVIYDVLDMLQQLGFMLTPPSPPEEK